MGILGQLKLTFLVERFKKTNILKISLPVSCKIKLVPMMWPTLLLVDIFPVKIKTYSQKKDLYKIGQRSCFYGSTNLKHFKCPWIEVYIKCWYIHAMDFLNITKIDCKYIYQHESISRRVKEAWHNFILYYYICMKV